VVKYLPPQTNTTTVAAKSRTASKTLFPHSHVPILIRPHGTTFTPSGGRPMFGGHADDEMSSSLTSATPSAAGDGGLPM
jgi:hypothetical protein